MRGFKPRTLRVLPALVLIGFLAFAAGAEGRITEAATSAVAHAALNRALAVGSESVVPKHSLEGATIGDIYPVHDPLSLQAIYSLVAVRGKDGAVVGLIGVDADLERVLWYRFNYEHASFPPVSSEAAGAAARARVRSSGREVAAAEPVMVRGYDRHFYWRFESSSGEAVFIDVDRPGVEAVGTWDDSAHDVVTPVKARPESGPRSVPGLGSDRIMAGPDGGRADGFDTRPSAYNMPGVPYHYQITDYNCGPAALEMVMDYYGEEIPQAAVADVANTLEPNGTYADDLRRAGHFSGASTAVQNPLLQGYSERQLGYSACDTYWGYLPLAERYEDLKVFTYAGCPVLILTWFDGSHGTGHYRVVKGYDDGLGVFVVHDPWYYGFSGPDLLVDQAYLVEDLWEYSYWWAMIAAPWVLHPEVPASAALGDTFSVDLKIGYPGPYPFDGAYTSSATQAVISLSPGLALAGGSPTVALPNLSSGDSTTVTWNVIAVGPVGEWGMAFQAQGTISGSSGSYPSYTDSIGGHSYETVKITSGLLANWSPEERLTNDAGSSQTAWPGSRAMVMEDSGTLHLVWADTRDGNSEIYYRARSGGVWGSETRLTNDGGFSDGPCLARGPDGRLHVAWVDTRDGNQEIYYKYYDPSAGWSADERVTTYGEGDHSPAIAVGGSGVYLAWQRRETGGGLHYYYVMFSTRTGSGWSAPTDVDASPERDSYRPSLAYGTDGRVHLVYERQTANLPNEKERVVYRFWNGTAWSSRTSLSTDVSYSRGPVIAAGADGTLHVVWQDGENLGGDIFYATYNGAVWQPAEEIVTGGTDAATPSVAVGGTGVVYVAWADHRHGESEIYFMQRAGLAWSDEVRLSRATGESMLPAVAANAYGDPCVVWTDLRHGNADLYFRITSDVSGVPVIADGADRSVGRSLVQLGRPYPVPSGSEIQIPLEMEAAADITIDVFDVGGSWIATVAGGRYGAGIHNLRWNGKNSRGVPVSSGMYFIRGSAAAASDVEPVIVIR